MKRKNYWAFLCLLCILGCDDPQVVTTDPEVEHYPVRFAVQLTEEILSFPETRAMPPLNIPEPVARKTEDNEKGEITDFCNTIEYIVFKEGDTKTPVRRSVFEPDPLDLDEDFGIINDSLPPGNYQIVFLAYSSCETTLEDNILTFNKITDTFHRTYSLNVGAKQIINENISLYRIVSKIEFVSTDAIPDNAKNFAMNIWGRPSQLDVLTGQGLYNPVETTLDYTFSTIDIGLKPAVHSFFTFVPEDEEKLDVILKAFGSEDEILREREVNGVAPIANHIIRYTGRLYTPSPSDEKFILNIYDNGEWENTNENELED